MGVSEVFRGSYWVSMRPQGGSRRVPGAFEGVAGVLEDLRDASRESQWISGVTGRLQGRLRGCQGLSGDSRYFRGISEGSWAFYGASQGFQGGLQRVSGA